MGDNYILSLHLSELPSNSVGARCELCVLFTCQASLLYLEGYRRISSSCQLYRALCRR